MPFPSNPVNNQLATVSGIVYQYNSTDNAWTKTGNVAAFSVTGNLTVNGSVLSTSVYADQYYFSNGMPFVSGGTGGGSGLNSWVVITANYTAQSGDRILANTAPGEFTITLPAAPQVGDTVQITDAYNFAYQSVIVNPNGSTIEGQAAELEINLSAAYIQLIYAESTWQVISSVGPPGLQGNIGYTGSQGIQGAQGYTGSQGDIGYTGSQGTQGITGFTGSKGDTGLGFAIAKSYNSVAALTADTSPTGIVAGQFAIIETGNVDNPENSRLYLWNGSVYSYVSDLSGNIGLTGPQGSIGFTGSQGIQGITGFTGSKGADGIIGVDGYTGSRGDVGYTGSIGFSGSQGTIGYTGSTGNQGTIGYTGSIGTQGADGFTGSAGTQGIQGNIGPIGYTGSSGTGSGTSNWVKITGNYSANNSDRLMLDSSGGAFNVTLPAAPSLGSYIQMTDAASLAANVVTVLANGSTIESDSSDLILDLANASFEFIYDGNTWQVTTTAGPRGYVGSSGAMGYTGSSGAILDTWTKKTSNYTAISRNRIIADTSSGPFNITLPASPSLGDYVIITDGYNFAVNAVTVLNNGSTIEGQNSNVLVNISSVDLEFFYDGNTWQIISTSGPAGFTGSAGAQGSIGYTGSTGSQGAVGFTGSTGSQGAVGFTGSTGSQGTVGFTGSTGSQGAVGFTGSTGSQGTVGFTGSTGSNGAVGFTGSTGSQGAIGFTGSAGTQGTVGFTGSIGTQGNVGFTGSMGSQGIQGNIGPIGYTGSAGTGGGGGSGYTGSQGLPGALASSQYLDTFTGNGIQTAFTLSVIPVGKNQTTVTIDGITQARSSYSLTGSVLTFDEAPALGDIIEVVSVLYGTTSFVDRRYTGNGVATTYTVTSGVSANSVIVTDNGLVQRPDVDYSITGNVIIFTEAPADQAVISIRELPAGTIGYTGSAAASVDILSPFLLMGG